MTSLKTMLAAVALAGAFALPAAAQQITGAGGTFPAPLYAKWGEAAKAAIGVELNYQAIGSGGGQNQIMNRTVDFGASDAPMDPAKIQSGNLLQFPTVMGAVVPIVNLPGITADQLKLTGAVLADIYLGKIAKWNDPAIAKLNPGLNLPNVAVASVHRADASGTSFIFTSYLSAVSPEWKQKVSANTSVNWPAGAGARGNDGVAGTVKNTRGGIGYVENAYATQNKLTTTQLQNKDGVFIKPTMASFQAAAGSADWDKVQNFQVDLLQQPGKDTWPIVSATYLMIPKDPKDPAKAALVLKWMDWCYAHGGQIAEQLEFIPLPTSVEDKIRAAWKTNLSYYKS